MSDLVYNPKVPQEANGFPVVAAVKDSMETFIVVCDRGLEYTERFAVWMYFERRVRVDQPDERVEAICHRGDYYYDRPSAIQRMIERAGFDTRIAGLKA